MSIEWIEWVVCFFNLILFSLGHDMMLVYRWWYSMCMTKAAVQIITHFLVIVFMLFFSLSLSLSHPMTNRNRHPKKKNQFIRSIVRVWTFLTGSSERLIALSIFKLILILWSTCFTPKNQWERDDCGNVTVGKFKFNYIVEFKMEQRESNWTKKSSKLHSIINSNVNSRKCTNFVLKTVGNRKTKILIELKINFWNPITIRCISLWFH